jgi:hypothetical protein
MALSKITAASITSNVISSAIIADGEITFADLANNTITGAKIASTTITGDKIGLTAITGNLVAATTITGDKIGLNAITGNLIAATTITGDKIGLNAITGNLIVSGVTLTAPALGTPASGNLSSCTADGTDAVGFRNIPQNSQSAAYTLVLADAGKHIFHPAGDNNARTFTIPANSSVAYPIGTAITFINMAVASVTIAITTDTLILSSAGTTGSRTLATNGSATCIKITSTSWLISGSGLT